MLLAPTRRLRATLPRLRAERPEAWVYGAAAACWAALLLLPARHHHHGAGIDWAPAMTHWLLMVGAMMLPMTAMALRHIAFRSFRGRRGRAAAAFLLGYFAVWAAAGPLYLAAGLGLDLLAGGGALLPLAATLALAALWQATPAKFLALRACHRTVPLPPRGWPADRACLAFGLGHGRHCLAACWALMLVPAAAGHHPALMLIVAAAVFVERRLPRFRPRRGVLPLAAAAGVCLIPVAAAAFAP